jgi:hypothetical protein
MEAAGQQAAIQYCFALFPEARFGFIASYHLGSFRRRS